MIYDCFMFFNELDLLEIRLNELNTVVDKFLIVEATKTHAGEEKPLYFNENKEKFSAFKDKIEHIIIDEYPEYNCAWELENYQRNVIIETLKERCSEDDVIIISDLDEIPRPECIEKYKDTKGIKVFEQQLYTFYFNYLNITEPVWTRGTRMLKFKDIGDKSLTGIRFAEGKHIKNAGWHFTYVGGLEMVKYKIKSFSHQEYNNDYYMNDERLKGLIDKGIDIFERGYKYKIVPFDCSFPKYIQNNKDKFEHLIIKQSPIWHRIKNYLSFAKRQDKRYIDTHIPINDNPVVDFISSSSNSTKVKYIDSGITLEDINNLPDKHYDCFVFDGVIGSFYNPEDFLTKLRTKLNRNGCIIIKVSNFRYIENLYQVLCKKMFSYKNQDIRFYTRKSLFDLIASSGYYVVTFKGLNPISKAIYTFLNLLFANNLYDSRHKDFLLVAKG